MSMHEFMWNRLVVQNMLCKLTRNQVLERFREPLATLIERNREPDRDYVRYRTEEKRNLILTVWFKGQEVDWADIEVEYADPSGVSVFALEGMGSPVLATDHARALAGGVGRAEMRVLRPARIPEGRVWIIRQADPRDPSRWYRDVKTTTDLRSLLAGDRLVQIQQGPFRSIGEALAVWGQGQPQHSGTQTRSAHA